MTRRRAAKSAFPRRAGERGLFRFKDLVQVLFDFLLQGRLADVLCETDEGVAQGLLVQLRLVQCSTQRHDNHLALKGLSRCSGGKPLRWDREFGDQSQGAVETNPATCSYCQLREDDLQVFVMHLALRKPELDYRLTAHRCGCGCLQKDCKFPKKWRGSDLGRVQADLA